MTLSLLPEMEESERNIQRSGLTASTNLYIFPPENAGPQKGNLLSRTLSILTPVCYCYKKRTSFLFLMTTVRIAFITSRIAEILIYAKEETSVKFIKIRQTHFLHFLRTRSLSLARRLLSLLLSCGLAGSFSEHTR